MTNGRSYTNGTHGMKTVGNGDGEYPRFRRRYLAAFLCATAADWLKGPYIYRLYEAHGFAPDRITLLFTAGYVSSAIFGAIAGMTCDACGRRLTCLAFCALYAVHALLHAVSSFWVLLVARIISGVATALLSCAFEAWVVAEHAQRFPNESLAQLFSLQSQANGIVAIASGLAAQVLVDASGDYSAPFWLAVPLLVCCSVLVFGWGENVGDHRNEVNAVFYSAVLSLTSVVVRVGLLQCLFEGSMHVFVFLWTPCLRRGGDAQIPHGLIFALYMGSVSIGGRASRSSRFALPLGWVFALAALALAAPAATPNLALNLIAFCAFEWCCGCYFPAIAMLRTRHLAEGSRAATITLFRIPLNGIVVGVLLWGRAWPPQWVLLFASAALALGSLIWCTLPQTAPAAVEKKAD